jgi:hypothetical protein
MSLSVEFQMQGVLYEPTFAFARYGTPRRRQWGYDILMKVAAHCEAYGAGATIRSQEPGSSRFYTWTVTPTDYDTDGGVGGRGLGGLNGCFPNVPWQNRTAFRKTADYGLSTYTTNITVTVDDGQSELLHALHMLMYWDISSPKGGVPTTGDYAASIRSDIPQPFFDDQGRPTAAARAYVDAL